MILPRRSVASLLTLCLVAILCSLASSCSRYVESPTADRSDAGSSGGSRREKNQPTGNPQTAAEHGHRGGLSGGVICSLGGDQFHTEAVFEAGGGLALFTLAADETRIHEVPKQVLTAYVQPQGAHESFVMILQPDPLPGDADAMTSRFRGALPEVVRGTALSVTIPGLRFGDERFTVRFDSPAASTDPTMPAPRGDEEARELYLTAGGLYTEADIAANGRVTAAVKYAGFRAEHNRDPQPGTPICPITETQANPECSWVIGGKTYTFCCPPCIDEFLARAKQHPDQVLDPEAYIERP